MRLIIPFLLIFCTYLKSKAQDNPRDNLIVIKSNVKQISYRENGQFYKNAWNISPGLKPDIHVTLVKGKSTQVSFITDIDSITFTIKPGDRYRFFILFQGDSAYTEIQGQKFIPPATYTKRYRKKYNKQIVAEVPEVYELVNIIMAITPYHRQNEWTDEKNTNYYKEVIKHFEKYNSEPIVKVMDSLLIKQNYHPLKMDAYAFTFDKNTKIIQSKIYDRISWGTKNTIRPYIRLIQDFAKTTNFRSFFKQHKDFYGDQIKAYRDSINIKEMISWLNKNFPDTRYNTFKVIWSPLVGGSQSANMFEYKGYKEAQAHVNFPYSHFYESGSNDMVNLRRGNILFTEFNHCFINPEADKYAGSINTILSDLTKWADKEGSAKWYNRPYTLFTEYLNWGLVSLRYKDYASKNETDSLITRLEQHMKRQGFRKFPEFNQYLLNLYHNKKKDETLSDLYPKILNWFKEAQ
jgi:hypothetical protein